MDDTERQVLSQETTVQNLQNTLAEIPASRRRYRAQIDQVETRVSSIAEITRRWREATGPLSDVTSARFSTPGMGPGGAAIEIKVQVGAEDYEIAVRLDDTGRDTLADLEYFELQLGGARVPLGAVADIETDRTAVLLTSIITMAGLVPLMFERSQQAQTLIPVATSIVFGILASTVLLVVVLPALYAILGDFGLTATGAELHDEG